MGILIIRTDFSNNNIYYAKNLFLNKNIIFICIDGGRADRALDSKVIQKFQNSDSVFFSEVITYAPYTNSALHALISGSYGNRNGCFSYWHSHKFQHSKFKTIIDYLHENGYYTCVDVPSDLIMPKKNYDEYYISDESEINLKNHHSELLEKMKIKNQENQSFFLHLHYSGIHNGIRDSVLKKYTNFSEEFFNDKKHNEERYDKLFNDAEQYIDFIETKLNQLKLLENSIIVIFSDHGMSLGEKFGERAYGALCYDSTIKSFMLYFCKGLNSRKVSQQIRSVDLMPTILEHIGINLDCKYESIDGQSFFPLLSGSKMKENYAYTETGNPLDTKMPPKKPNTKSIRTSEWKLIVNEYNDSKELYNLKSDPLEENNLINRDLQIESELWIEFLKNQKKAIY